jgi:hypothetical protein
MIPKIIHYCWFGGSPKPKQTLLYISRWKQLNPNFKIIEWNESNFNVDFIPFTSQAYKNKKYAFVSDVVRIYVLVHYGGIYLDTDVELLRPFSKKLLDIESFVGFERSRKLMVGTAIIGSIQDHPFWNNFLKKYYNMTFAKKDGTFNEIPNVNYLVESLSEYGLKLNDTKQCIANICIFPCNYFSPKNYVNKKIHITNNTYAIHHFAGTWQPKWKRIMLLVWVPFSAKFPKLSTKIKTLLKNQFSK